MNDPTQTPPEDCPEPFWHETHHYCPCCSWVSPEAQKRELEAAVLAAIPAKQQEIIERQYSELTALQERLEQAEAEVERLRCCGNCGHLDYDDYCHFHQCFPGEGEPYFAVNVSNSCHFTPSRWAAREEKP